MPTTARVMTSSPNGFAMNAVAPRLFRVNQRCVAFLVRRSPRYTRKMADTANIDGANGIGAQSAQPVIHPLYVRITHWINALAMLVMIGSGWQIYNASPLFAFTFPRNSLGGWLAGGLLWHFAALWLLVGK